MKRDINTFLVIATLMFSCLIHGIGGTSSISWHLINTNFSMMLALVKVVAAIGLLISYIIWLNESLKGEETINFSSVAKKIIISSFIVSGVAFSLQFVQWFAFYHDTWTAKFWAIGALANFASAMTVSGGTKKILLKLQESSSNQLTVRPSAEVANSNNTTKSN